MKKDTSIVAFLAVVEKSFNLHSIKIVDYWDADLCAIGLQKGNRIVYVSTYGKQHKCYDYEFEVQNSDAPDDFSVIDGGINIREQELLAKMSSFLMR